jgi:hypothetical protein
MSEEKDAPAWCKQQEIILKKWSEEAMAYRYMHDRSYKHFARLHMNFSLPVIIISTVAGTANFATGSFPAEYREWVSIATGGLGLMASMITTIAQFLKIPEMLETHRASSTDFAKFSRNIRVELSLPVRERSTGGREFINQSRLEMEQLMEKAPDISLSLVRAFGSRFKKKEFHMPDIIDLTSVEIYDDIDEANRLAHDAEKKVQVAARRMLEEKERAQVSVSNVSESLSSFMTSLSGAVEKTSAEIETEMRGEKKEE